MTFYQEVGLTVIVYEPFSDRAVTTLDKNISGYSHDISAVGGFDRMSVSISDGRLSLDEWIERGVGRRIVSYNQAGIPVWEGFVNVVRGSIGAQQIEVGPLMDIGNRVMVAYSPMDYNTSPPTAGETTVTTVAENEKSQTQFGIIEKVVNAGRITDEDAESIRDTFLKESAYPATSSTLSFGGVGGAPTVTLECLGYWYFLNAYVFNEGTSGAIQVDNRLKEILDGDPNSLFEYVIDSNNTLVPAETEEDKMAMAHIKELLALGGANDQRYTMGVYENRVAHYKEIPSSVAYKTSLSDQAQKILTYQGALVYPWDVRPAQWMFISDALIGRHTDTENYYEDPRYIFIEQVSYSVPWSINIVGSRVGTIDQALARLGLGSF